MTSVSLNLISLLSKDVNLRFVRQLVGASGMELGGTTAGGGAMVATVGDPADPVIIHTSNVREAELTSSHEEEKIRHPPGT